MMTRKGERMETNKASLSNNLTDRGTKTFKYRDWKKPRDKELLQKRLGKAAIIKVFKLSHKEVVY